MTTGNKRPNHRQYGVKMNAPGSDVTTNAPSSKNFKKPADNQNVNYTSKTRLETIPHKQDLNMRNNKQVLETANELPARVESLNNNKAGKSKTGALGNDQYVNSIFERLKKLTQNTNQKLPSPLISSSEPQTRTKGDNSPSPLGRTYDVDRNFLGRTYDVINETIIAASPSNKKLTQMSPLNALPTTKSTRPKWNKDDTLNYNLKQKKEVYKTDLEELMKSNKINKNVPDDKRHIPSVVQRTQDEQKQRQNSKYTTSKLSPQATATPSSYLSKFASVLRASTSKEDNKPTLNISKLTAQEKPYLSKFASVLRAPTSKEDNKPKLAVKSNSPSLSPLSNHRALFNATLEKKIEATIDSVYKVKPRRFSLESRAINVVGEQVGSKVEYYLNPTDVAKALHHKGFNKENCLSFTKALSDINIPYKFAKVKLDALLKKDPAKCNISDILKDIQKSKSAAR